MTSGERRLTHLTASGEMHMVDVGQKEVSRRLAVAEAFLALAPDTLALLRQGGLAKGDALAVGRLAGIMAAKRTAELIPLCHPLALDAVEVTLGLEEEGVRIRARVQATARTGAEMEALVAVSVGGLALYDMVKGVDRSAILGGVRLIRKEGGKSGTYVRPGHEEEDV
ncbi:MAG: cyclic pyranopterin monophosphate synthase MoaC [Sulfobacillus sp.]